MNNKEKLITDIIKRDLEGIVRLGKDQEKMLDDLRKNGYGDIHPFYQDEMKSGISYSYGYTVGHKCLAEIVLEFLEMTEEEIQEHIAESERIAKENKKYAKKLLKEIKSRKSET